MMALFKKKAPTPKGRDSDRSVGKKEIGKEEISIPAFKLPKGEDARSYQAILSPHITEKATSLERQNKYVFVIAGEATKIDVKKAIEKLYKVKVENVHVLTMPSKFRQVGKYKGRKTGFKKAIITLKEGDRIEITG